MQVTRLIAIQYTLSNEMRMMAYWRYMAHTPAEVLQQHLAEAKTQVEVGARYAHYKHPEQGYTILALAFMEADESLAVVYEQEGSGLTFVRPLTSFLESVDGVQRFQKLN